MKNILVTGGAGYIGSHTCLALAQAGFNAVIVDNYSNSDPDVPERLARMAGDENMEGSIIRTGVSDIRDTRHLEFLMRKFAVTAVIHLAGLKSVGDSVANPMSYYYANVCGSISVVQAMQKAGVEDIVFSSSATVYGEPGIDSLSELLPVSYANPYAHTKIIIEQMLEQEEKANPKWRSMTLRYFNPVGAHPSGKIADRPKGKPLNLMPVIVNAAETGEPMSVFGTDYNTPDGTCIRDYIHVMDLASGHVDAVNHLLIGGGSAVINLGTGEGYSVLEVIYTFERVNGVTVPFNRVDRRPGDVPRLVANVDRAWTKLGWEANLSLAQMCRDAWNARTL